MSANTPEGANMKPIHPTSATYGPPTTEAVMAMLFNQCQDALTLDQLEYIQRGAANAVCTLNNVQSTLVNVALSTEKNNNFLADENAATAFLYSLADQLGTIGKTLELADMARVELSLRGMKAQCQKDQGRTK